MYNHHSITSLSVFSLFKIIETKKQHTKEAEKENSSVIKTLQCTESLLAITNSRDLFYKL